MYPPLPNASCKFDTIKHVRMVPPFYEDDVDKYFTMFEKVAISLSWPRDVSYTAWLSHM